MTEESEGSQPKPRSRRSRNTTLKNFDDIRVIRRLAALGARAQAIRMAVGGPWTQASIALVTRNYLGRGDLPGRRPTAITFDQSHRDRVHWTLAHLLHEIAKCWPRGDADMLADAYEMYAFISRHVSETRIAIESCAALLTDIKYLGMQLAHCRECRAPRLIHAHKLGNHFVCESCGTPKTSPPTIPSVE